MEVNKIICGEALAELKKLPSSSIDMVITSPPYWALRDYGIDGQLGIEPTFKEYVNKLCDVFDEVKRVLKASGACWVNLGDTYYSISGGKFLQDNICPTDRNIKKGIVDTNKFRAGKELPQKSLCNIPSRFCIEMQNRGWILRNKIIWYKKVCMPSPIKDRFTIDYEELFFFVKNQDYYFETQYEPYSQETMEDSRFNPGGDNYFYDGLRDNAPSSLMLQRGGFKQGAPEGRIKRCVWTINPRPFTPHPYTAYEDEAHFAVYPEELIETPIKSCCASGGIVLDMFFGSGTTGIVALKQGKKFIGIEINPTYVEIAKEKLKPYLEQTQLGAFV